MTDMPVLFVYDDANYDPAWTLHRRDAVRSIIVRGSTVAMVKSATKGFYQFPGGGIDTGESHEQALARETLEEAGLVICPQSVRPFGIVRERRASQFAPETIFDQTSYYYLADAEPDVHPQVLENYEKEPEKADFIQSVIGTFGFTEVGLPYPLTAKYHMNLCGIPTENIARNRKSAELTDYARDCMKQMKFATDSIEKMLSEKER